MTDQRADEQTATNTGFAEPATPADPSADQTRGTPGQAVAPSYQGPVHNVGAGPIGKVRSTGVAILLALVTFGIYTLVWYYLVHEEMKKHSGHGLGGGVALLLAFFVGPVMPYLTASEVGGLYERAGQNKPVSGLTGLWYFPGMFLVVGPLVWFIKTNGALNSYWRSLGAR